MLLLTGHDNCVKSTDILSGFAPAATVRKLTICGVTLRIAGVSHKAEKS